MGNNEEMLLKVINDQSAEINELEKQNRALMVANAIGYGLAAMLSLVIYYKTF